MNLKHKIKTPLMGSLTQYFKPEFRLQKRVKEKKKIVNTKKRVTCAYLRTSGHKRNDAGEGRTEQSSSHKAGDRREEAAKWGFPWARVSVCAFVCVCIWNYMSLCAFAFIC